MPSASRPAGWCCSARRARPDARSSTTRWSSPAARARSKASPCTRSIEPGLPSDRIDTVQMERVIANLLGNAIKFTPAGGARAPERAHRARDAIDAVGDRRRAGHPAGGAAAPAEAALPRRAQPRRRRLRAGPVHRPRRRRGPRRRAAHRQRHRSRHDGDRLPAARHATGTWPPRNLPSRRRPSCRRCAPRTCG